MRDTEATTVHPRPPSDNLDDRRTADDPPIVDTDLRTDQDALADEEVTDERVDSEHRPDELGDGELDESTQDSRVLAADVIMTPPDPIDDADTEETPITAERPIVDETPLTDEPPTDETPTADETSTTDETPSTDETPYPEETQPSDVTPVPVAAETPAEGTPATAMPAEATVGTRGGLWAGDDVEAMRERWRDVQLRFVDDPELAAREAGDLVDEAAKTLVAAIEARRAELSQWRSTSDTNGSTSDTVESTSDGHDAADTEAADTEAADTMVDAVGPETRRAEGETERMRVVVQAYRSFLDEVLQL